MKVRDLKVGQTFHWTEGFSEAKRVVKVFPDGKARYVYAGQSLTDECVYIANKPDRDVIILEVEPCTK